MCMYYLFLILHILCTLLFAIFTETLLRSFQLNHRKLIHYSSLLQNIPLYVHSLALLFVKFYHIKTQYFLMLVEPFI